MSELNKTIEEKIKAIFGSAANISDEVRLLIDSINDEFNEGKNYRSLYENAVEGIFQCNESGGFITVNPSFAKLLKYSSPTGLITSVPDLFKLFPDTKQRENIIKILDEKGLVTGLEVKVNCKDNERIWVNLNIRKVYGANKEFLYFEGCLIDITEQKYVEDVVIESENRFRALIENGSDMITLLEETGKIRFESPSVARLLGYENLSKNIFDIIHPDDCGEFKNAWDECLKEPGKLTSFELRFLSKDGLWKTFEVLGRNMLNDPYVEGIVLNSRDITERKKVEEELREARTELEKRVEERTYELTRLNDFLKDEISERSKTQVELVRAKEDAESADKIKTEFLAQVSHEIRTPINVILNYSSLIRFELEQLSREDLTQLFNSVERASSRLMRTIDLIVNMAQIQTHTFKPSFRKIDIMKILNQLLSEYGNIAKTIGIDLTLKCEAVTTTLLADEYTVSQVFLNLIDNATKYTREGGVEIRVYSGTADSLCVDVKDTGIGIAPDFIPKLFTPFVQEETGYTRRYEGNGLGLAIVKKYVELNNGEISVRSEKGKGSVFTVCFKQN